MFRENKTVLTNDICPLNAALKALLVRREILKKYQSKIINKRTLEDKILLIVEGHTDLDIVKNIFNEALIPSERINFMVANGMLQIPEIIKLNRNVYSEIVVLVDLDINNNYESEHVARLEINSEEYKYHVFTAVPSIESWLFSDIDNAYLKSKGTERTKEILSRLPMPDDIPYPRQLANNVFGKNNFRNVLNGFNIHAAASRSPSFRKFVLGISDILCLEANVKWEDEYVRTAGRDVFAKLVDEVIPPESIVYKTLDGEKITAKAMSNHIMNGTKVGMEYSVDVLRIARDMLARKANR